MDNIEVPKAPAGFFYHSDTMEGRLERFLISQGIEGIGDPNYHSTNEAFKIKCGHKKGDERPIGLNMDFEARIGRTIQIKMLSQEQLLKLHAIELRFGEFLYSPQIAFTFKLDPMPWSGEIVEYVAAFQKENRVPFKEWEGFKVPPYFIFDFQLYDGLCWQQDCDLSYWNGLGWNLPQRESGK